MSDAEYSVYLRGDPNIIIFNILPTDPRAPTDPNKQLPCTYVKMILKGTAMQNCRILAEPRVLLCFLYDYFAFGIRCGARHHVPDAPGGCEQSEKETLEFFF